MDVIGTCEDGDGSRGSKSNAGYSRSKPSTRERMATSCSECRRRKQKCNQGQPCNNCARRFPPPVCEYRSHSRSRIPKVILSPNMAHTQPPGPACMQIPSHDQNFVPPRQFSVSPAGGYSVHHRLNEVSWDDISTTTYFPGTPEPFPPATSVPMRTNGRESPWPEVWPEQNQISHQVISSPYPPSPTTMPFTQSMESPGPQGIMVTQQAVEPNNLQQPHIYDHGDSFSSSVVSYNAQSSYSYEFDTNSVWVETLGVHDQMVDMSKVPVQKNRINQELLNTFVNVLSRCRTCLDGNPDASSPYMRRYVPWCLSSNLLSHVALYTSACFLFGGKATEHAIIVALKSRAIGMLNQYLRNETHRASDEAIAASLHLILDEWYWGQRQDLKTHLRGLKGMISVRGGIGGLGMGGVLGKLAFAADRCIALSLETRSFLSGTLATLSTHDIGSSPFRVPHNTPLVPKDVSFVTCSEALELHPITAKILDETRFLLNIVLGLPKTPSSQEIKKLETTAKWTHDCIASLSVLSPSVPNEAKSNEGRNNDSNEECANEELLHKCIRLASLLYITAITERQPLSRICTETQLIEIWTTTSRIPLTTWKAMLGIYLWLVFSVAPTAAHLSSSSHHVRSIKTNLNVAISQLALESWEVAQEALNRMDMLQQWLSGHIGGPNTAETTSPGGRAGTFGNLALPE